MSNFVRRTAYCVGRIDLKMIAMLILGVFLLAAPAQAIPELQVYIEGSTYDSGTETWVMTSPIFKVWVLGDVSKKPIYGVNLAVAYDKNEVGSINISSATASAGSLPIPGDPSTPVNPSLNGTGVDTAPITGDGSPLQSHDIFGLGTAWTTYYLGDFTLTDSPIGDYISNVPTIFPDMGQINVYEVNVNGYSWVHFDAYDHVVNGGGKNKYVFAPFSHDGEGGSTTPEPASLALLGVGCAGLLKIGGKRRSK